ncbi:MAG TPA: methyltransferase domain-containing protein [Casimicrobiaceae bacterium]|nr:methyltransferase domain-containing protein [Casimicrobiaceae bacterium]
MREQADTPMNAGAPAPVTESAQWREPFAFLDILPQLRCPVDMRPLAWIESESVLRSSDGERRYPVVDGIPCLFAPNEWPTGKSDVTDMVKSFYEETPFPNYDDLDGRESLRTKAKRGVFVRLLDEQIERPSLVFEAGCGTGQLSNFLGMNWGRRVIGGDLCLNSLRLAKSFRDRCSIANVQFVQINLFRPPFPDATFDVVVSNGVLHHTSDPEGGFHAIARTLKPGGHIIIGLYNWLGRLPTLWRRALIETFGARWAALDPRLRGSRLNTGRWAAWFMDQYQHPHESRHSMAEVERWFDTAGIDLMMTIPPVGGEDFTNSTPLFRERPRAKPVDYFASELEMLVTGGRDGGLYMMIGRKRSAQRLHTGAKDPTGG